MKHAFRLKGNTNRLPVTVYAVAAIFAYPLAAK